MATTKLPTFLFPPPSTPFLSTNKSRPSLLSPSSHHQRPLFPLHAAASPTASPINVDYLGREFGGHGVTFEGIGDGCVVKMGLDNGSTATMMLPSALITSYKPHVWHGGTVEVLHTCVEEGEEGEVVVKGGVSLGLGLGWEGDLCWNPSSWALHDVKGSSDNGVQVELISIDPEGTIEIKYVVTLREDVLSSEMLITNNKSSSLQLTGSVISHLKVSTPDATFAFGLKGASYIDREPLQSDFSITLPDFGKKGPSSGSQNWGQKALQGILRGWGRTSEKNGVGAAEEIMEGEEEDNCVPMADTTSKIYTCAPREFTMVDRGRRNSVIVERSGFEEFYVLSPGSEHEWYGKYSFVCIAPSAMLTPIKLGPRDVWFGAQYLHNPNM